LALARRQLRFSQIPQPQDWSVNRNVADCLCRESSTKEVYHLTEGVIRCFGVVAWSLVTHEGMLGWVKSLRKRSATLLLSLRDLRSSILSNVGILGSPHEQQFATNFTDALERSSISVRAQLSIVNAGPIKTDCCLHLRVKSCAKR